MVWGCSRCTPGVGLLIRETGERYIISDNSQPFLCPTAAMYHVWAVFAHFSNQIISQKQFSGDIAPIFARTEKNNHTVEFRDF